MKETILNLLRQKGDGVSFVELSRIDGFNGKTEYGYPEKNIFLWFHCSETAITALTELNDAKQIEFRPTDKLVYFVDGGIPKAPIAKSVRTYSKPHWLPSTLYRGQCFPQ